MGGAMAAGASGGGEPLLAAPPSKSPIQIGVLLGTFRRKTFGERLRAAKEAGVECAQVSYDDAGLGSMPERIDAETPARMRREAEAVGVGLVSVQGTFNMSHPDPEHRKWGLGRLRVLAGSCAGLGVDKIHVCSGTRNRNSMWLRHPDNGTGEAWRDMVECMREAAEMAREAKVTLAFEPEVNNVVDSARKARRLMDEVGSPHLKVTMDAANLFHTGDLGRMREVLEEAFALVGRDIVLAHAKDLDRDGDAGHLAAGQGKLDYGRYFALLREYRYEGPMLLHSLSEAQVPGCVEFLRGKKAVASR